MTSQRRTIALPRWGGGGRSETATYPACDSTRSEGMCVGMGKGKSRDRYMWELERIILIKYNIKNDLVAFWVSVLAMQWEHYTQALVRWARIKRKPAHGKVGPLFIFYVNLHIGEYRTARCTPSNVYVKVWRVSVKLLDSPEVMLCRIARRVLHRLAPVIFLTLDDTTGTRLKV